MGLQWTREFRLSPGGNPHGISCDARGLFVGLVPLLTCTRNLAGADIWAPRPAPELDTELTACYGLPIDIAAKSGGLATVAGALNRDDLALAKIAAVQMQFPDPPDLAKGTRSIEDTAELAAALFWSGLLKGEWDPDKHPRIGEPRNRGWFAPIPKEPKPPAPGWPLPHVNSWIRDQVRKIAATVAKKAPFAAAGPLAAAILEFLSAFSPTELNQGEERAIAQMKAYFDPPKTLDELRSPPQENALGYERHHIVGRNPDNIKKVDIAKFGIDRLEQPDNIVWIPRLKHEEISAEYNSRDEKDPQGRRTRDVVGEKDFDGQMEEGLKAMRKRGILK